MGREWRFARSQRDDSSIFTDSDSDLLEIYPLPCGETSPKRDAAIVLSEAIWYGPFAVGSFDSAFRVSTILHWKAVLLPFSQQLAEWDVHAAYFQATSHQLQPPWWLEQIAPIYVLGFLIYICWALSQLMLVIQSHWERIGREASRKRSIMDLQKTEHAPHKSRIRRTAAAITQLQTTQKSHHTYIINY